ncbi:MAG: UDP-2,3-diacylglucosamine diphosphatase [Bacteroidaceae bacterium]|nr:UDP-2,3-diacylglucosamine diphosphatase [Bacteroidaceae bacterium]
MKNVYFISDAHLGCRALEHGRTHERRLVNFLGAIKPKAEAVYILGDLFDFWFEYKDVVPKGFTRVLGKIAELTDSGVEVHFFVGNHDMWVTDYLHDECGVVIHHEPCTLEIYNKVFFIAHGHLIDTAQGGFWERMMMWLFRNQVMQSLARSIHPHFFIPLGYKWARHSHIHHHENGDPVYRGEDNERLVAFAKDYLVSHPEINYFMFGHRHIDLDLALSDEARVMILGQWYSLFTYVVFDGNELVTNHFIEGETKI